MDEIIKDWEEKLKDFEADCALIDLEIQAVRKERDRNRLNHTELAVMEMRLEQFRKSLSNLDWALARLKKSYYPYD